MTTEQLALFGEPSPAQPSPASTRAPLARQSIQRRPTWTAYRGPHRPCDEGIRATHNGTTGHLDPALYARTYLGEKAHLCTPCAIAWRQADGMAGLPTRARPKPKRQRLMG